VDVVDCFIEVVVWKSRPPFHYSRVWRKHLSKANQAAVDDGILEDWIQLMEYGWQAKARSWCVEKRKRWWGVGSLYMQMGNAVPNAVTADEEFIVPPTLYAKQ
jgi:hypothetical protein